MSRHLNNEGIYFINFEGDVCFGYADNQLHLHGLPEGVKLEHGTVIPDHVMDYVKSGEPHTVLHFNSPKSIEVMIECLAELKVRMSKHKE